MRADLLRARALLRARPDAGEQGLYAEWYHAGADGLRDFPAAAAYRAATLDPARLQEGWRVQAAAPGAAAAVVAVREVDVRTVAPPDCVPEAPGVLTLSLGTALRVDPLAAAWHDGFWHLWAPAWRRRGPPARLQRLYFAVAPGAELAFAARTAATAPVAGNWSMKFLSGRHPAGRRDRAVLYAAAGASLGSGWVARLITATAELRAGAPPPLTREVAAGVGQAPEPGDGTSFGQAVCRRLAAAAAEPGALADEAAWVAAATRWLRGLVPEIEPTA